MRHQQGPLLSGGGGGGYGQPKQSRKRAAPGGGGDGGDGAGPSSGEAKRPCPESLDENGRPYRYIVKVWGRGIHTCCLFLRLDSSAWAGLPAAFKVISWLYVASPPPFPPVTHSDALPPTCATAFPLL